MGLGASLVAFLSCIVFSLFCLYIVGKIASKYLNGDYFKETDDDSDIENDKLDSVVVDSRNVDDDKKVKFDDTPVELHDDVGNDGLVMDMSPPVEEVEETEEIKIEYEENRACVSSQSALRDHAFKYKFASQAYANFTLEYNEKSHSIIGWIISVDKFSFCDVETTPNEIRFHARIITNRRKYRAKTSWKNASEENLSLSFVLGPLKEEFDAEWSVCIRLYGKKKSFGSKMKCYGELSVPVLDSDECREFCQQFVSHTITRSRLNVSGLLSPQTTDSESESIPRRSVEANMNLLHSNIYVQMKKATVDTLLEK